MRYHFIPTRIVILKNSEKNKYWRECGNAVIVHCWWEWKMFQLLCKMVCLGFFFKKIKQNYHMIQKFYF